MRARLPKYLSIADDLRGRLAAAEWAAETALPSQRELAEHYGVTIMTLRHALQLLEDEHLVISRHGTGTFPAPPRYTYDLTHLRSLAHDLTVQGAQLTTQVLHAGPVAAPDSVAARLEDSEVFLVRRLRLVDDHPLVLQNSYLPAALGTRIDPAELAGRPLYDLLAELGAVISGAGETIEPVALAADDALLLGRAPGTPALLSRRLSHGDRGTPVVDDSALMPAGTVTVAVDRGPGSLSVNYLLGPG
jgi:GntR family transcriptional regulator